MYSWCLSRQLVSYVLLFLINDAFIESTKSLVILTYSATYSTLQFGPCVLLTLIMFIAFVHRLWLAVTIVFADLKRIIESEAYGPLALLCCITTLIVAYVVNSDSCYCELGQNYKHSTNRSTITMVGSCFS